MNVITRARAAVRSFHESDRADIPVGTILMVAFIVIPLVLLLIVYRKQIVTYFTDEFNNLFKSGREGKRPGGT